MCRAGTKEKIEKIENRESGEMSKDLSLSGVDFSVVLAGING